MTAPVLSSQLRRGVRLEQATIAYNALEGIIAVGAGLAAGLVSLVGFGIDSAIEVAAAAVVLARLTAAARGRGVDHVKERRALRFIALTFFALAAYVVFEGMRNLLTGETPDTSRVGIALTGASMVLMPLLARSKQRAGEAIGSRLLVADAAETRLCAWLSVSTFVGLTTFWLFGWTWLDSAAGFVIALFAVAEGREAWAGEIVCEDGCS
ncbi:MAG: hypothetical protein AVDCRST_MAG20-824 [uncultured Acidimicrobiales bacterium]|uniref:Cation efflux protein transmembrane domain-containing protein n=1 Tax=uncultured Acidimicrobiales bacterium TaxID=310071 RepID=A0A6J4HH02_9ACTN|nr:MAG: hypothetical protein AVDCRST_MAG20-824 [uncultured Acidimicrobiales bacterium]